MTEREALLAIRDRAKSLNEAIQIARKALEPIDAALDPSEPGAPGNDDRRLDITEPISVVES